MKIYSKNKIERITKDYVKKHLENHGVCFGDLDSLLLDDILRCYDNDAKKLLRSYNILKSESQNILFGETLTDFDIYYSSAHGIPIVHETLSILYEIPPTATEECESCRYRYKYIYKYYTYKNDMLCEIDIKDLQNDKNYNALYGDATPNTKKFWDISNLPKYDFVALYIKSKYTPYIELAAAMMSLCACTYTFTLFDFDLEIIKLNPSDENYLELLNIAKNDETFIDNYNKLKTDN